MNNLFPEDNEDNLLGGKKKKKEITQYQFQYQFCMMLIPSGVADTHHVKVC